MIIWKFSEIIAGPGVLSVLTEIYDTYKCKLAIIYPKFYRYRPCPTKRFCENEIYIGILEMERKEVIDFSMGKKSERYKKIFASKN